MRIIAGSLKGRNLKSPSWEGVRPTSDRLRETLFNILAPRVVGARVLDGYAGTGAVGIEALSRGAAHVTLVDRDRRAVALIRANLTGCQVVAGYTIELGDVATVLSRDGTSDVESGTFDLILLDPPYDVTALDAVLRAAARRLAVDGLLVLERASRHDIVVPDPLVHVRDVVSGDSTLTFLALGRP